MGQERERRRERDFFRRESKGTLEGSIEISFFIQKDIRDLIFFHSETDKFESSVKKKHGIMIAPIPEIQVAVKFIVSCMYGKLPRRRADLFAEELSSAIQTKFQVNNTQ